MKLAFTNLACPGWSLEQIAANAVKYGYSGVELRSHSDNKCLFPNPPLSHRKYVRELFKKNNLDICCVSAYSAFASSDEEILEKNRQILIDDIILARDLNAPMVRSFLGEHHELTHEQIIDYAAPYLNYCADFADSFGVKVVFETHDAWCSGALMKIAFDKITSDGAAVLWDMTNNYCYGETVGNFYELIGGKCVHAHLKDVIKKEDGKFHACLLGEGESPVKECFDLLKNKNYQGYITFEWEKRWEPHIEEPEVALPHFIKYLAEI
jgi:sugar phosphate isomerase/epimerase